MKLICTQENFRKAIYNTEKVVGKQISLPILENILLEAKKGILKTSGTNLEIGVSYKTRAKIEKEGKITIPAKLISNFISNLPAQPQEMVSLKAEDSILEIISGNYHAQIKGLSAQEYPIIPEKKDSYLFSFLFQELKNAVPKLLTCVSVDMARPELTGVNLTFLKSEVFLAATDSFRLAEIKIPITLESPDEYSLFASKVKSVIIPIQALSEIARVLIEDVQKIKVAVEENQFFFQVGPVDIVSRLINGKYPEYKHIIPEKFATEININREELVRAVRIASAFTNAKTGEVSLEIDPKSNMVEVFAQSQEIGLNKTKINIKVFGERQKIVFNPRYLLDGLNSANTALVRISLSGSSSPALIRMVNDKGEIIEGYSYVVMPIKN
jgi:DNA polymerase III subunit beta